MALQTKVINGKSVEFDPVVRDEILKQFLPDGGNADANLADWAVLIAGVMLKTATKNATFNTKTAEIYINRKSTVVDGATNYISASSGDWKAFAKAVVTAIIGTGAGIVSGVVGEFALGPVGGVAVGFFAGNAVSSQAGQYWDYLFGPDVNVLLSIDNSSAVIKSSGLLEYVLRDHWINSNKQLSIKDIANTYGKYTLTCASGEGAVNYTYEKSANKYTYASGGTKHNLEELLKYLAVGDLPTFTLKGTNHKLYKNFMNSSPLSGADLHDHATLYAALELQGFVLESETERYNQLKVTDFSDMFLNDRAKMFNAYTHEPTNLPAYNTTYIDLGQNNPNSNFITYDPNNIIKGYRDGNVGTVVFGTDSNDTYGAATGMGAPNGELHLYGRGGNDTLYGNIGNDWIEGGDGGDTLEGGVGNDVLIGGITKDQVDAFTDTLHGGDGTDTYVSGDSDHIMDSDGKGWVYFEGKLLHGGTKPAGSGCGTGPDGSDEYYGDGGVYRLSGSTLTFIKDGKILTFEDYIKNDLNITLKDNEADNGACPPPSPSNGGGASCPKPVTPFFNLHFSLPTPTISYGGGSGGGGSWGWGGGNSSYSGGGVSTPHRTPTPPAPKVECINYPNYSSAGAGGGGSSTGPIILDLNRDGITSISLAASQALFDYDGDGVLENTAWIQATDALLVNDVNGDGIINDASELFGNYTKNSDGSIAKSGYQALSYYDTNSDGVVDAADTRFEELKLWIDSNQDGVTDAGELKTLTEMGVTSLALNSATPYVATAEETNTIIQETTFTDANGEGVMRDVLFRYENTSTNTDGVYFDMDGNGIKEKMLTWTDPNQWLVVKDLNGDGLITSGREIVGNHMILNNGTTAADTIQALKTFDINHDGVIDAADNSGLAFWTDRNHNGITDVGELEALGSAGAIQTIKLNPYQTLLSGYDNNHDGVIDDSDQLAGYLYIQTNADDSVTLYLPDNASARAMIAGYTGGESIQTSDGEKIIKNVLFYDGYEMDLNDTLEGTDASETLEGSSRSETLRGMGGRDILDAGAGDDILEGGTGSDKLMGGAGNDTYIYSRGDGKDLIIDTSGADMVSFSAGITRDDLIIKSNGVDISIYLKDGTNPLSELTDQIIIKDWHATGSVETLSFSDGTTIDAHDMVAMFSSDKDETVYGTDNSEILRGGKGNDVLQGRGGSDTYLYGRGDGQDTIIDSGGIDTLEFDEGISADDLIVKKSGNDIIVGLKENGVAFEALSDTITFKNWYVHATRLDRLAFSDGTSLDVNGILELMGNTDDVLYGSNESETFSTFGGNDTIYAGGGNDIIDGGKGNDILYGDAGNDTLIGGKGDDIIYDYEGSDTYIFNRGDGHDTIYETGSNTNTLNDVLKFGEGITKEDLIVKQSGDNLIVGIKEEGIAFDDLSDKITFIGWNDKYKRVDNFSFSDGTNIDTRTILQMLATDGDDNITMPYDITMDIDLKGGNDTFNGRQGLAETVSGGSGNDTIHTNGGNDTLIGGLDNDTLYGGAGDDTYIFNRGDGVDTIIEESGTDTLRFGEGIGAQDLRIRIINNDLIVALYEDGISFEDSSDKITISNWHGNSVENIVLFDGTLFDSTSISALMSTDGDDVISGTAASETLYGFGGNDILNGLNGNDILIGGKGDDLLQGGLDNDTYIFNRGDGHDSIIESYSYYYGNSDTLKFGNGITKEDLTIQYYGNDLIVGLKEEGKTFADFSDTVTLKNWLDAQYRVESFVFTDGSSLNVSEIALLQIPTEDNDTLNFVGYYGDNLLSAEDGTPIYGLGGNDIITTSSGNDVIYGGDGNDIINAGDGNNTVYGGDGDDHIMVYWGRNVVDGGEGNDAIESSEGNDILYGGSGDDTIEDWGGNDVIEGGKGNDTIIAGDGQDTYVYNIGDGIDTILNSYYGTEYYDGGDIIKFGNGITKESLIFTVSGKDLSIKFNGSENDEIIIKNWIDLTIDQFEFADGTKLLASEISTFFTTDGNDIIVGSALNDTITCSKGNDTISGGSGNDSYVFSRGDGTDTIVDTSGTDTIVFGSEIGVDDLIVHADENNLIIALKEEGKTFGELSDKIIIRDWYNNDTIEYVRLADGTVLNKDQLMSLQPTDDEDNYLRYLSANDTIDGQGGNDTILAGSGNDTIYGGSGNDILQGEEGDDALYGGEGNDTIYGNSGSDILSGGAGDDSLQGGDGNDVYIFDRGDGRDTIIDYSGINILRFGADISADDLVAQVSGNHLIIGLKEEGKTFSDLSDKIILTDWYNAYHRIETIRFADGSSLTTANAIVDLLITDGDDMIKGTDYNETITAGKGNDTIITGNGNDILFGEEGDDSITANFGDDTLIGGPGNDILYGGSGDDIYVFNRGDGHDTVYDSYYDYYLAGTDTLKFAEGITQDDLIIKVSSDNNDLIIALKETDKTFSELTDTITIKNWFNINDRIENITFSDGSTISASSLIPLQGTDEDDTTHLLDTGTSVILDLKEGNDILTTGSGNDTLIGGRGNDTLNGGSGNDTYIFNIGDGQDTVFDTNGTDTLYFGEGISKESIIVRAEGKNLILALREDGIAFENLHDKVTIIDWYKTANHIENFHFSDGTLLGSEIAAEFIGTDAADILTSSDNDEIIMGLAGDDNLIALAGDDTLIGGKGNDTLQGGTGNDVYSFNSGDGSDIVIETSGDDTLLFGEGITAENLIVKIPSNSNDLIVALKEDGKAFDDLSDKVVLKDWFLEDTRIEHFMFSDGSVLDYQDILDLDGIDETLNGTVNNDLINGYGGHDTIDGGRGDDILKGGSGNDILFGGQDIVTVNGYTTVYGPGADILDGGKGNDLLEGGTGNDTYLFGRGDGHDTIIETRNWYYNASNDGNDTLRFKDGISPDDILIKQIGNDLVLALKEEGKIFDDLSDKVTITNWSYNEANYPESWAGYNSHYGIENFVFANGTIWNTSSIIAHIGTDEDDVIYGLDGADTLSGGKGNDTLYGRGGNDTYLFNRGDGRDTIYDSYYYDYMDGGNDTLKLGEGITAEDIIIQKSGLNIIIGIKEEGVEFDALLDKITILNWFKPNFRIDNLVLSDGNTIDLSYLLNPTEDDDYLEYGNEDDIVNALGGDDEIHTNYGNDTITGGTGNDILYGGYGNDTYVFNRGDGQDWISDDDSSYSGNVNIDTIRFGVGVTQNDLIVSTDWSGFSREEKVLTIALKEEGVNVEDLADKISISSWDYQTIERFQFSDGTILSLNDIIALQATNQDDTIIGTNYDDILNGKEGNDTLYGFENNDILVGSLGDDTLYGGNGNDTYVFNRGDGHDTIYDDGSYSYYGGESYYGGTGAITDMYADILEFGDTITINDIVVEIQDGDLLIGLKDSDKTFDELSDTIRISGWASNYNQNAVETIRFSNGDIYNIAEYFNLSYTQGPIAGPIVFDLNGNGVTSTAIDSNNIYFDYNADGLRERTGWIERGDALLAVDLNHDGIISNGSELFGDHTKLSDGTLAEDGYAAMVQYDSNSDGKIDSSDAHFNDLLLWKDTNLDGRSSSDELSTLADNGIESINLTANPLDVAENGNRITYETGYTSANGTGTIRDLWFTYNSSDTIVSSGGSTDETGSFSDSFDNFTTDTTLEIDSIKSMGDSDISSLTLQSRYTGSGLDGASAQTVFEGVGYTGTLSNVWLKSDTLDTQYTYNGTLSDEVKALPNIAGQGNVINLQEAMNEKSELASSVTAFQTLSETGNLADFEANIDAIIEGWALYDLAGENANATPPIVLDLNGNGITSQSLASSSAYFDYNGDGRREHTAWVDAGDALLAIDLDNDGVITHGAELFGNYSVKADGTKAADGYDAMVQYDTNGDNVLDASDEQFSQLRLWKDLNQNGKNDAGELSTLAENGISGINLSRTDGTTFTQITEEGNSITNETNYIGSNGDGTVRDVWFSYDGTDTIAYSNLSDSDEKKIAIVENFYGRRLNSEERNSVEVIAEVLNQYNALRYDTIAKIITDKLYGEGFPNCQFLHDALNNTLGRVVGGVASTTETLLAVNLLAALLKREHVGVLADIYPMYFSNPTIAGLLAQSNIVIGFQGDALIGHIGNQYFGTSLAETINFSSLDSVRAYMGNGDDTIIGTNGIDVLVGGEGNDILNGNGGNDVLEGGQGDDTLIGGASQNVYRYAWGDGIDTIIDAGSEEFAPDTLRFSDLDISRVSIERVGNDMVIHIRDEEGALLTPFDEAFGMITIKDGYTTGKIEHFYFQDTRYTFDEVLAYVPADTDYYFVQGDARVTIDEKGGEDTLHFGEGITQENIIARIIGNDLIIGLAQEGREFDTLTDRITILNYADAIEHFSFEDGSTMNLDSMIELAQAHLMINGSTESETLYGTSEGETFNGGAGDDTIYGEAGDDTYKFGLGDGFDTIVDTAGDDTIILKEGVLASEVILSLDGEDLLVSLSDGSRIRVVSWISTEGRIEHIKDALGTSVDFSAVLKPVVENTTIEGDEDTLLEGSLSVTDISGTPLVYAIAADAQYGTFELDTASGEWIYEPNSNFNSNDSVIISVTNGYGVTSNSTIILNVLSVNDAPTIDEENITVILRNTLNSEGQIVAADVEGDTLSYSIETQAVHGAVSVDENGKWQYTAVSGYAGEDSAVISVNDGNGGSTQQTLNFSIIDNVDPEAPSEINNILQDIRVLNGEIGATDADNDTLSYNVSTAASHGTLSVGENGTWNYVAEDGYMGSDNAVITIDDGNGGVITQTLNFDINVSAPILSERTVDLLEDTATSGVLNVLNPVGGALVYEILNTSTKGNFTLDENGNWNYDPSVNLNGTDSVTLKVTNSYGLSTTATLDFAIEAVNDAPILTEEPTPISLNAGSTTTGSIKASDADGDTLSYTVTTAPEHGTLTLNDQGEWSYTSEAYYAGENTARVMIDDGHGGSVAATLNFTNLMTPDWHYIYSGEAMTISDSNGGEDTFYFTEGITLNDIIVKVVGNDLILGIKEIGKSFDDLTVKITMTDWYDSMSRIENIAFSDGTVLDVNAIVALEITDGDDTIKATETAVTIDAQGGNDTVIGGAGDDYLDGNTGNDTLIGNGGDDYMLGWDGNDILYGGEGDDTLKGEADNDTLYGDAGADYLDGGEGDDTLFGGDGNDTLDGNAGSDTLYGDVGDDLIYGWDGNDTLYGGEGDDTLKGEADNDTLYGEAGADYLDGGDGDDTLFGGDGNDTLDGNAGSDTLYGDAGDDYILGWDGNDTLYGGEGNDILKGENGNDTLDGGAGIDTLIGGMGDDTYIVDTTTDIITENANEGIDTIQSSVTYTLGANIENLTLTGTSAINATGNTLDNTLIGNGANNTLNGKAGADTMIGGDGNDLYYVDNIGDQVIETATGGTGDTIVSTISWTLGDNIEVLRLSGNGAINGTGNALNNSFYSGDGDNVLDGGAGNDNLYYSYATSGVNVSLEITTAQNTFGSGMDTILNIENLIGSNYDDNFIGNSGANILRGGKGNDSLQGGTGNDTYSFYVGDGVDTIYDHDMNGSTNGGTDKITFMAGITESSVALYMNGNDLVISYGGTDTVTIINQSIAENAIEKVSLSDGYYLSSNDINTIIQSMNSYASSHDIAITSIDSVKANQDLMNIVAAGWHQ